MNPDIRYHIDIFDNIGRRIKRIDRVPLMQIECGDPTYGERVVGLVPPDLGELGHTYRLRFYLEDELQADVPVRMIDPQHGDIDRWILHRLVEFTDIMRVEGRRDLRI